MRLVLLRLFFLIATTLVCTNAFSQICTGSLGDPVINETFGAGTKAGDVGNPLSFTITNLQYTTSSCPGDGQYALVQSSANCFDATWNVISSDHTGDPHGYMMVINAYDAPSVFYTETISGSKLCPNTTYEFATWILNILKADSVTAGYVAPNITFTIKTSTGILLKTYNTGDILAAYSSNWIQYGTSFTTPSDGSDIIVKLSNNASGSYGNDFVLDDITVSPCGPVIKNGFGIIGNTAAQSQCVNTDAVYTMVASQVGYDNATYQWQVNKNDGNGWNDIPGATSTTLTQTLDNPQAGDYEYRVGVLNGNTTALTCRIYSAPLTINVYAYPVINILAQTSVCEGNELRLVAQGGDTYQWTGPNGFTSSGPEVVLSEMATAASDGVYTVKVSSNGCSSFASTVVNVYPKVKAVVSNNVTICQGASTTLTAAQSLNALHYKWTPATGLDHDDQATVIATPSQTTLYTVAVSNDGCTDASKTVNVTVLKRPFANAGDNKTIKQGQSVTLNGTATGDDTTYYWTPADYLDNASSLTPLASPVDNTTYTLHAVSNGDCGVSTSSVFVRVFKTLTIPNTFTPNNDGVNDYWDIKEINTYPDCLVSIYNRYGQLVFQSAGYPTPWDGKYNNELLPVGTYYYIIDLKNNLPKEAGWLLLVR